METPDPLNREQLLRLIDGLIAGQLNDEQRQQLEQRLASDKAARELYYQCVDLDIGLRSIVPAHEVTSSLPRHSQRTVWGVVSDWLGNRPAVAVWAVAAACLLIVATIWLTRPRQQSASESAQAQAGTDSAARAESKAGGADEIQLTGALNVEFLRESLVPVGSGLKLHKDYAMTSGMLELRFPQGAEAIIEAPADFRIESLDCLVVRNGKCSVYAPPGAEGFQVLTPNTKVTDRGTRFSVAVNDAGDTKVQVVEGLAEVENTKNADGEVIELRASQAQQFAGQPGDLPSSIPFEESEYKASLPDRILGYEALTDDQGRAVELTSIEVQRGGKMQSYSVHEMTAIELIHFRAGKNCYNVLVPNNQPDQRTSTLEKDSSLISGLINFGGSRTPLSESPVTDGEQALLTPGMAFRFRQPIINAAGPDVVLIEVQSIIDPVDGDAFHVSPLKFRPGLRSHTIQQFDITMKSPKAVPAGDFKLVIFDKPCRDLAMLDNPRFRISSPPTRFWLLAAGIDLSDLGYSLGESVDGLFLQDADDDNHEIDPVFIAGLPPIP